MKKSTKRIFIWGSVIILLGFFYYFVLFPAYLSVISVCNTEKFVEDYPEYRIVGVFIANETTGGEIFIAQELIEDKPTLAHENCHKYLFEKGFSFGCDKPILNIAEESICYSIQRTYEVVGFVS